MVGSIRPLGILVNVRDTIISGPVRVCLSSRYKFSRFASQVKSISQILDFYVLGLA